MTSISQCIVCHKKHFELQSMQQASASGLPLFSLFERILGFSLEPELLLHNVVCPECVNRFYDYDAAFQRAERAASELIELFGNKVIDPFSYEYTIHVKPEDLADVNIEVQVKNVDNKSIEWSIGPPLSLDVSRETAMSERKENKQKVGRPSHFPCQKCSRKFRSSDSLADHECIVNARPFVCDICGLTYKTKGSLATHMIIHSGIRRHSCEICGKAFTQRIALARHISIHTGQMNYQCDICGKQFIHYSSFHMHKLAHDDVRSHQCSTCGIELRSSSHLARHMLVHSGAKPHTCSKCGQKFAQRYNMMAHFKTHLGIHRVVNKTAKPQKCPTAAVNPC